MKTSFFQLSMYSKISEVSNYSNVRSNRSEDYLSDSLAFAKTLRYNIYRDRKDKAFVVPEGSIEVSGFETISKVTYSLKEAMGIVKGK
jgi:hypothetical protein